MYERVALISPGGSPLQILQIFKSAEGILSLGPVACLPAGMAQYGQYGSIWSSSNVVNQDKMAQYSLWYSIWHDMESRFQYGSNMAIQSQYGFNMDQYGSNMESNMVGPKISNMDQYGPIWNQYGSIWKNFQYGSIWTRQFADVFFVF